jgi:hypothetical protein
MVHPTIIGYLGEPNILNPRNLGACPASYLEMSADRLVHAPLIQDVIFELRQ